MIILYVAILLVASNWLPWWFIAIFSLLAGAFSENRIKILTQLVSSVFLTWMVVSYYLDFGLSGKVGMRLSVALAEQGVTVSSLIIYPAFGLVGAILALFFGLLGFELKKLKSKTIQS